MPERLGDGVWRFDLFAVNVYLVDDDVLTLVDAGLPWHTGRIRTEIRAAGFDPADLKRVLLTHYDPDHVGTLASLPGDQEIRIGEADLDYVTGRTAPGFGGVKEALQQLAAPFLTAPEREPKAIQDGERIGSFTAIHTPGHGPGHMAFVSDALDVAFVGDLVRSDGSSFSRPPWYLNTDTRKLKGSLDRLIDRMAPVECVAPGHGDPICENGYRALRAKATHESAESGG